MTETEFAILDALAAFQYLTVKQLHRLKVTKNEMYIYALLEKLESHKLIERMTYGFKGAGKAYVWRLIAPGARAHAEEARGEPVAIPKRLSARDREHALRVVDFHI